MTTAESIGMRRREPLGALVFRVLVQSSAWVSAAVAAMLFFTGHLLGVEVPASIYVLAFSSAMFVMNFDHVVDARFERTPQTPSHARAVVAMGVVAVCAALVLLVTMTVVSAAARMVCVAYALVGVAYGLPLFPRLWRRPLVWYRLKDIRGIKAWLVSAAIVFAMIGLPVASSARTPDAQTAVIAVLVYLIIVSNAHMFDVRDLRYDRHVGNTTLPTLIGAERTRLLLMAANVAALAVTIAAHALGLWPFHPELELALLLTLAYIRLLPSESAGTRYALIIDGCLFVLPVAARLHETFAGGVS